MSSGSDMAEIVRTIPLSGFDPEGEPVIRIMSDGTIALIFEFLPPSLAYEETHDPFDEETLERELEEAAGVAIIWEDRERFLITEPKEDTIERIRAFVEGYGRRH